MEGYIGEIRMFGGSFAPLNWAYCDGRQYSISNYEALYTIIGTIYGGDGVQTFCVPNMSGRLAVGANSGKGFPLGMMSGTEQVTMTQAQMPQHTHPVTISSVQIPASNAPGNQSTPNGNILASPSNFYTTEGIDSNMKSLSIGSNLTPAGNSVPFSIVQPYTALIYIICMEGLYPSRA